MFSQDKDISTPPLEVDGTNNGAHGNKSQQGHPWPHLSMYFAFKYFKENNAIFSCVLCRPKEVIIKGHKSSLSNLKSHIRRKHKEQFIQFEEVIKTGSRRGHHRVPISDSSLDHFMYLKDMKDRNPVGVYQEMVEGTPGGVEVEDSKILQNCIAFVNVDQIKTEEDDPVDVHDEPLQEFSHQKSSHMYSEPLENSFCPGGKREKSVSPTASQEPDFKKIKNSSMERTDDIISVVNRLEKVLISETNRRQEDLFDVFGRSVSDQLRQLPRRQAIMAQSKIQNLLIQEFLEHDNLSTSKSQEQPP